MSARRTAFWALVAGVLSVCGGATAQPAGKRLGAECTSDDDCGSSDLFCFPEEGIAFFTGGPAGGLCTSPCETDADCAKVKERSQCTVLCEDEESCAGICVEGCERNRPLDALLDPEKCHGRENMACLLAACLDADCARTIDQCAPFCQSDAQCGKGRFCNGGFCNTEPPEGGKPAGSPCDFAGLDDSCSGSCDLDVEELLRNGIVAGICVEVCIRGTQAACGGLEQAGPARACLGQLNGYLSAGFAAGDIGTCLTLCDCTSDCSEGEICDRVDFDGRYAELGVCTRAAPIPGAPDCLGGSAGEAGLSPGCANGPVRACNVDACLGTSECLEDGSYGECRCLESDPANSDSSGGATDTPDAADSESGCGCELGKRSSKGGGLSVFALSCLALLRRGRRRANPICVLRCAVRARRAQ